MAQIISIDEYLKSLNNSYESKVNDLKRHVFLNQTNTLTRHPIIARNYPECIFAHESYFSKDSKLDLENKVLLINAVNEMQNVNTEERSMQKAA